ncbi:hypothetical protein E1B28_010324 [Marasmius oreades]|uniref:Uncharacterized protein n=1 Tax=Marasmius oreades TaxID=181124 RepID=A0A9P7RX15_9AGAR|nr:uncharacterized protein E1B28_010324 [Marasmius oreades]KAG7091275.1 hypothetical protein E1B28_010324 [Marasmius oreades]
MSLPGNSISIGLTIRYPPPGDPENFHWLMWLVAADTKNGICVHANNNSGAFKFEAKPWNAATSQSLSALVQIGTLNKHTIETLTALLKAIPMASPDEDRGAVFNCRIWVREAVRVLERNGVLKCDSVDALQAELLQYAQENRENVEQGKGKATFHVSKVSR